MAYDSVKAHEYYVKYKKKGLKKGRKKGSSKTKIGSTAFLGVSSQGFNDEGRMQAALIKENIKKEMKTALASAKTDEERQKIRLEYSKKAQQEINKLKSNAQYIKPKTAKASSSKSSKSSGSSKSNSSSKSSSSSSKKTTTATTTSPVYDNTAEVSEHIISSLTIRAEQLMAMAKTLPPETKKKVAQTVKRIIEQLKLLRGE